MRAALGWLLAMSLGVAGNAAAYCEGGYPNVSVANEVKRSDFVIVGKLESYRRVVDPEDPEGYDATLYRVHVDEVLRGPVPDYARGTYLTIYNENSSARFPFEDPAGPGAGKRYLMLVRSGPDGYWVDPCGNSGELEKSRQAIREIRGLAAR
jgi:hypothetical protein